MFAYDTEVNPQYAGTGNSFAMLSNRISWTYDLRGSSVSVDSACSSGLVGLELACQSLMRGESEMVSACRVVQIRKQAQDCCPPAFPTFFYVSALGFFALDEMLILLPYPFRALLVVCSCNSTRES